MNNLSMSDAVSTKRHRELNTNTKGVQYGEIFNGLVADFNRKLSDIEKRLRGSSPDKHALFVETMHAFLDIKSACENYELVYGYDKSIIKNAQIAFREETQEHFTKSYLMNRTRTWPEGYPGDYKTLETTYGNAPMSDGIGEFIDRYFLQTTLAMAVRERLNTLCELLIEELQQRKDPTVLNVACGSCREIFDIASAFMKSNAKVTCLDHDSEALKYSEDRLKYLSLPENMITYRRYNAFRMVNHDRNVNEFGYQDIIYSTGFYDYVEDKDLIRMLNAAYKLLNPGGTLIASFKDCERYSTVDYHWLVKWNAFYQRTLTDMDNLLRQTMIPDITITKKRDKSGVIVFYLIQKPA